MKTRSKLMALLGAAVLTVGVVGVAFAEDLKDGHTGLQIGWDGEGNPQILDSEDNDVTEEFISDDCGELEAGTIEIHFVLSPTDADSGNLTVDFDPDPDYGPQGADGNQGSQLDWDVTHTGPVTLVDASTDVDDTNEQVDGLKVSHICIGEEGTQPSPTPTFGLETGGVTDAPSEPSTDSIGTSGTSGPADGAWLLVVALGVLLASIVVLTPARARSRR
jgi:hypothetical protein